MFDSLSTHLRTKHSLVFIKTPYRYEQMLITINISNLFLAFKYVKHYHLGQMVRSIFQLNIRIKIMIKQALRIK